MKYPNSLCHSCQSLNHTCPQPSPVPSFHFSLYPPSAATHSIPSLSSVLPLHHSPPKRYAPHRRSGMPHTTYTGMLHTVSVVVSDTLSRQLAKGYCDKPSLAKQGKSRHGWRAMVCLIQLHFSPISKKVCHFSRLIIFFLYLCISFMFASCRQWGICEVAL